MNPLDPLSFAIPPPIGSTPVGGKTSGENASTDASSPVQSSISDLGRALSQASSRTASSAASRYQDIEDSDLPDAVKSLLRMIRDLRERLAELARKLQEVQADDSLDPEVKRARLRQIQAQMSALNGALMTATRKMASLLREMTLGKEQQMSAAMLALK